MNDRPCIRGCTIRGEHFAACPDFGKEDGECRGCRPKAARDRALICEGCYRRLRRFLDDAPDLIGHIRSIADPTKATRYDAAKIASTRPDIPAPVAPDLIDASEDIMRMLREWERTLLPTPLSRNGGMRAGLGGDIAYDEASWCTDVILASLDILANRVEVKALGDAVLTIHVGEPPWWSVADALSRWPLKDPARWADKPCPNCDTLTVRVAPSSRIGGATKYFCTSGVKVDGELCEWEANDQDDDGLWALTFEDRVPLGEGVPHDARWLTLAQAAHLVKRTTGTVRGWVKAGLLEPRDGRYWQDAVEKVAAEKRGEIEPVDINEGEQS